MDGGPVVVLNMFSPQLYERPSPWTHYFVDKADVRLKYCLCKGVSGSFRETKGEGYSRKMRTGFFYKDDPCNSNDDTIRGS